MTARTGDDDQRHAGAEGTPSRRTTGTGPQAPSPSAARAASPRGAPPTARHATPLPMAPAAERMGPVRHCWEIIQAPDNDLHGRCDECYAYFVRQDCWTLWALREAGHKPCCQKKDDCATCPVLLQQVAPQKDQTVQVRAQLPAKPAPPRTGSAKQVCRYLDAVDVPVPPESPHYLSAVSRAVQARTSAFRCRLRGVHLDVGYVADMCVSRHVQDCVFLEEAHPEVTMHSPARETSVHKMPFDSDEADAPAKLVTSD